MRQVVLDTETTGLDVSQGHRIIEIGCVELVNRKLTGNHFHHYINPRREIDQGAIEVHGITSDFLADKPLFEQIAADFLAYVAGAELIIHNAPFDLGFLDSELQRLGAGQDELQAYCTVVDTLVMARAKHPGQRNNLDALCQRYLVDNSQRELHGALLDAEILADVYLAMTGGQTAFALSETGARGDDGLARGDHLIRLSADRAPLPVIRASAKELAAHESQLDAIAADSGGRVLWREL
ncbi:MAG: DNA polymerase III subunit epsilon [Halioglobus sp.]|nr:DNA polymerase III subunit epsilon [Halioglobus sp.]